mmetsp:Transcript_70209/g.203576  ORF Transcript_70209/g.203576 Transcript_70209/m.203576 type:complete len:220 (+) Transcript_70209:67-726(+)
MAPLPASSCKPQAQKEHNWAKAPKAFPVRAVGTSGRSRMAAGKKIAVHADERANNLHRRRKGTGRGAVRPEVMQTSGLRSRDVNNCSAVSRLTPTRSPPQIVEVSQRKALNNAKDKRHARNDDHALQVLALLVPELVDNALADQPRAGAHAQGDGLHRIASWRKLKYPAEEGRGSRSRDDHPVEHHKHHKERHSQEQGLLAIRRDRAHALEDGIEKHEQ